MKRIILALSLLAAVPVSAQQSVPRTAAEREFGVRDVIELDGWRIRSGTLSDSTAESFSGNAGDSFCYATQKSESGWILGIRQVGGDEPIWFLQAPDDRKFERVTYAKLHVTEMKAPVSVTLITMRNGTLNLGPLKHDTGALSIKLGKETMYFAITGAQRIYNIVAGNESAYAAQKPAPKPKPQPPP